jgi:Uma2 family endonuclease
MAVTEPQLLLRSTDASWSRERWERLPDDGNRYEVIDGVLYRSTAPSGFHQWIVKRLVARVGLPAEDAGIAFAYFAPFGVFMPGCDPVQPDFLLIRQERAHILSGGRAYGVPDLIAEVLSPSNPSHDVDVKRRAYVGAGVPEYWIVRPATRDVLVYWQPDAGLGDYVQVRLVAESEVLESATMPLRVAGSELFAGSPDDTL